MSVAVSGAGARLTRMLYVWVFRRTSVAGSRTRSAAAGGPPPPGPARGVGPGREPRRHHVISWQPSPADRPGSWRAPAGPAAHRRRQRPRAGSEPDHGTSQQADTERLQAGTCTERGRRYSSPTRRASIGLPANAMAVVEGFVRCVGEGRPEERDQSDDSRGR